MGKESYISALISSLVIFKNVADGPVLSKLRAFGEGEPTVKGYTDFVSELYKYGINFSRYMLDAACEDENIYVHLKASGKPIPPMLESSLHGELRVFSILSSFTSVELKMLTGFDGFLPDFEMEKIDYETEYQKRLSSINRTGYGIYARHNMFRLDGGKIVPIKCPDPVTFDRLIGYEDQRALLIANTRALLSGKPAANALLRGDAGTGKSSSVKALVNMFAPEGLRLVEIKKNELKYIPSVIEELRGNPLKFILFIDDLSFNRNDYNFTALKAILEGSASVKSDNTVIYATSNRRHLIRESFSDRDGDDVHRTDTMQELLSLADRFGLSILYAKPSRQLYLEIVHGLIKINGIDESYGDVDTAASAFALRKGGFTPRAAEQFVNSILGGITFNDYA